jgi:hypothetical protein
MHGAAFIKHTKLILVSTASRFKIVTNTSREGSRLRTHALEWPSRTACIVPTFVQSEKTETGFNVDQRFYYKKSREM